MRTSIIFIVAAFAVLLISMGIYDQQLHTAFKKGTYKIPFSNYVVSDYTRFRNINLRSASTINIKIQRGPFRVLIQPSVAEHIELKMNSDTLHLETFFPDDYHNYNADFAVYIWCPELSSIRTNGYYHIKSREYVDKQASEYFMYRRTVVNGFKQDSLSISATNAGSIWLLNDTIRNLNAVIGIDSSSATNFYIGHGNQFQNTNIDVRNVSRFWIDEADTAQQFHYTLSDSAKLIVSGRVKHLLKTQQ